MWLKTDDEPVALGSSVYWHPASLVHLSRQACISFRFVGPFCTRCWRSEQAHQVALEQWAVVRLQAFARGRLARTAVRRMLATVIIVQARWRGISGRAAAAVRKMSVMRVQALVRGKVAAAWYREACASTVALQACWRGAVARTRLATEAAVRAEAWARKEENAARTLQAFARGGVRRTQLRKAEAAAAAVLQEAWVKRQARLQESRGMARAAVAVQAWWRMIVGAEGQCTRYGDKESIPDSMCPHVHLQAFHLMFPCSTRADNHVIFGAAHWFCP